MHIRDNNDLLKTKIVATVGQERGNVRLVELGGRRVKERDEIYDPDGNLITTELDHATLLKWLIMEGVDVIRLNMSFATLQPGSPEEKVLKWLNKHREGLAKHVAVLGDLPGPKIRLRVGRKQSLEKGRKFFLDLKASNRLKKNQHGASVLANDQPFEDVPKRIDGYDNISDYINHTNTEIVFSLGDGDVKLRAERESDGMVMCTVSKAGEISDRPGLTIKHAKVDIQSFQEPDENALRFLLNKGNNMVAYVGLSFVRDKDDVLNARYFIENYLKSQRGLSDEEIRKFAPALIAKIETREAIDNINNILDAADGIMVARGDLGLQLDPQDVPAIQKQLVRECNLRGKPIITATQMLDSMIKNMEPTRAEAADVFNAILDGTDAIMLSGETSKGKYPVQAVRTMVKIAEQAEQYYFKRSSPQRRFQDILDSSEAQIDGNTHRLETEMINAATKADDPYLSSGEKPRLEWQQRIYREKLGKSAKQKTTDRICQSACLLSEGKEYKGIIAPTKSGRTARMISRFRPNVPILGVAHDFCNARKLILSFGVYPLCIGGKQTNIDQVFDEASQAARRPGYISWRPNFCLLQPEDMVISTSGTPLFVPGTTNLIQIRKVSDITQKQRRAMN